MKKEGEHTFHKKSGSRYVEKESKRVDVWRYKKYLCKVKKINIQTGKRIVLLNTEDAKDHDVYMGYRTEVKFNSHSLIAIVDTTSELIKPGEVGIYAELAEELGLKEGNTIEIVHMNRPSSLEYIKKKLDGGVLSDLEINTIVDDIMDGKLGEAETAAWVSAAYIRGFADPEIIALANATVKSGEHMDIGKKGVVDKHCSGGVVGNRTTMLIVPIIASTGLYIPKTSSRAITSPSGTADTVEVLAEVNFSIDELKDIVLKSHGAMVWGGGIKLAPVDDKLIRIRNPLSLDPEGMLLASILGKKKSVGAEYVVIDIPVGRGAKFTDMTKAQQIAKHFIHIGNSLGMEIEALITDGAEPIGNGIGPGLECRDVLEVLEGNGPEDLRHKSCTMAGKLLELCGKAKKGEGYRIADGIIRSGKAIKKFKEIIELQGGDGKVKSSDIPVGHYKYDVKADVDGQIFHIDNKSIAKIARIAGAPMDKGAGVYLYRLRGDRVKKGDRLFTIHAESETKLSFAVKALKDLEPVEMRRIVLGVVND